MHPALAIDEIVELICNSVEPGAHDNRSRETALSALARTATTFTHSALNGLWEQQTTLINVLCLPADLWDGEGGLSDDGPSFHLLRPVTQTDMECLLVHSSRVKAFHFTAEAVTAGICRLLEEIRPFLPQGFLFPNLRSLSFSGQTSKRTELLDTHLRLISPLFCFGSMHDLRLWVPGGFKLDDATVWDLAGSFPKLRCLYLASSSTEHCAPGMTLAGLRAFATHFPQLKRMRISFDAAVIPPAGDDIFLAEFTWLDVLNSPIGSPPHVARFLSGIFPMWGGKAL
ncbi:hypothetical protein C8J57DRAFT_1673306 [Mycena rebaudengoi]|nr:hypothetical protein C8J57DRAFT_1673306 [Mycena rebaudengoi]